MVIKARKPEQDVSLWQVYCLFESLRGSVSDGQAAFESAFSALSDTDDRLFVWQQFVNLLDLIKI